jgi:GTP-binding protein
LHIVDVSQDDPVKAYRIVRKELEMYNKTLAEKQEVIVLNKKELLQNCNKKSLEKFILSFKKFTNNPVFAISAASRDGVRETVEFLYTKLVNK